jgi:hypothetical protein
MQVEHPSGAVGTVAHVMPDGQVFVDWGTAAGEGRYGIVHPDAIKPAITPEAAGATVVHKVDSDNEKVAGIADDHAAKLQAAGAPKTAEAIKAVAEGSNKEASVTAEEFLAQAQRAAAERQGVQPGVPPIEPAAPTGDARFAPPEAPAVAAPAAAPEAPPAAPATMGAEPRPAVVVGGQVFTGDTPAAALIAAHDAVGPDAMATHVSGWVDPATGRFASRDIYDTHQAFNAALDRTGGNVEHPEVRQAGADLVAAQARDAQLQGQITQPGGERVVDSGIKGQQALTAPKAPPEVARPLEGVTVHLEGVDPNGERTAVERNAAEALNEARNDRTALTLLFDCLH